MKKVIKNLYIILSMALIIWVLASWGNIVAHNTTDCQYWKYNAFVLLAEFGRGL